MAIPLMSNYNFKAGVLAASDNYLLYFEDRSEEPGKGTLYIYYYPSLILCNSVVIKSQLFSKVTHLQIAQGYLITNSPCFQVFTLPDLTLV
jgi:hypothetical protein